MRCHWIEWRADRGVAIDLGAQRAQPLRRSGVGDRRRQSLRLRAGSLVRTACRSA